MCHSHPSLSLIVSYSFFANKGAVAGVFTFVGLAILAIFAAIFLFVRRRRRIQKMERDTAVSASLAAAGFKRTDLDDGEDDDDAGGDLRSRITSAADDLEMAQRSGDAFDPYGGFVAASQSRGGTREGGYMSARLSSPTLPTLPFMGLGVLDDSSPLTSDSETSARDARATGTGHASSASYEPLLAAFAQAEAAAAAGSSSPENVEGGNSRPPTPPPRNPLRAMHSRSASPTVNIPDLMTHSPAEGEINDSTPSHHSSNSADYDDRLNPKLMQRTRADSIGASTTDLRDDQDYSRPVLAVRNMTNLTDISSASSHHS